MDLLTLAELLTLVRMLADVVGAVDRVNMVVERHIDRRLHNMPPLAVAAATNSEADPSAAA